MIGLIPISLMLLGLTAVILKDGTETTCSTGREWPIVDATARCGEFRSKG